MLIKISKIKSSPTYKKEILSNIPFLIMIINLSNTFLAFEYLQTTLHPY